MLWVHQRRRDCVLARRGAQPHHRRARVQRGLVPRRAHRGTALQPEVRRGFFASSKRGVVIMRPAAPRSFPPMAQV